MDQTDIEDVRRFNRSLTRRIGVLDESYLGRGRPLGQARLLFEIGPDGCDLKTLRDRLGLDSGYLSRLAATLVEQGLVELGNDPEDGRRRRATLTAAGLEEWRAYDALSDRFARSLLAPLDPARRQRLVDAMREVERLVAASSIELDPVSPESTEAKACLASYVGELEGRFETGFDAAKSRPRGPATQPPRLFLVARLEGRAVGCGALYDFDADTVELKRMWVAQDTRGLGIARRLLDRLESEARNAGMTRLLLDTNRTLTEAMAFYEKSGYRQIDRYNDNPYADFWYEKTLG
ncbi:MAG: bifunctional helix-turn-helix transcriptional regulator/GNAT family N-acetyltransferase [Mesorhizobium sp.]|nr:bifunctional helix-turn-helix transcriptional regulator/GNAT family N-acetyltransferase [Mesorhizobium sp.]